MNLRIVVRFLFNHEEVPFAVTGVEGEVSDVLLPSVGDLVQHSSDRAQFEGRVTGRSFRYALPDGHDVDGDVTVTLSLDRVTVH
jgi:hypothetical protein